MFNPVQLGSNFARNAIIRYAPLAVGLMTIEHLFRSTAPAVGLKPSAMECKACLRGLERNNFSKTIYPRSRNVSHCCMRAGRPRTQVALPADGTPAHPGMQARRCGGMDLVKSPRVTLLHAGGTPAHPGGASCGRDARAPRHAGATLWGDGSCEISTCHTAPCGCDARAPRHAGATPAHPGMQARHPRTQACGRDARAPRHAGATPAHPGMRARRPRTQACRRDTRAPRHAGATPAHPDLRRRNACAPRRRFLRARRPRTQACGRNACAPRHAGATPAHPDLRRQE
jgi:hypothetical protein